MRQTYKATLRIVTENAFNEEEVAALLEQVMRTGNDRIGQMQLVSYVTDSMERDEGGSNV